MAKSQYSNGYSIDISETLSKGYQSAMNTMKNGYQWVRGKCICINIYFSYKIYIKINKQVFIIFINMFINYHSY